MGMTIILFLYNFTIFNYIIDCIFHYRKIRSSYEIAEKTESIVEKIITHGEWNTAGYIYLFILKKKMV